MPPRSKATLESWLEEFDRLGYPYDGTIRAIDQDGGDDADSALVAVRMADATTFTYVQPDTRGGGRWLVTFEAREDAISLDAPGLSRLASEIATLSALCTFLEAKSRADEWSD